MKEALRRKYASAANHVNAKSRIIVPHRSIMRESCSQTNANVFFPYIVKGAGQEQRMQVPSRPGHNVHGRLGAKSRADERIERVIHDHGPSDNVVERRVNFMAEPALR